jgi:hypothetical protein
MPIDKKLRPVIKNNRAYFVLNSTFSNFASSLIIYMVYE